MYIFIQNKLALLFMLLAFFLFSNSHADAFKCIDKQGNTVFQDSECGDNKKETKIEIKKYAGNVQCTSVCDSARAICVADLGLGDRNTSKGLLLCEQAKQACDVRCYNPSQGRELEVFTAIERSSHERELRHQQALRDDEKYQELREQRVSERDKKRKQRHCYKYEKKLAKIKARWVRKQQHGWKPKDEEYYRRKIDNAKDDVRIECQR
jgi:hypothetical protein